MNAQRIKRLEQKTKLIHESESDCRSRIQRQVDDGTFEKMYRTVYSDMDDMGWKKKRKDLIDHLYKMEIDKEYKDDFQQQIFNIGKGA